MRPYPHIVFSAAIFTAGILCFTGCKKEEQAVKAPPVPVVKVVPVETRDLPVTREWVASLDGSTNVEIRARVQGYLVKQNYSNGSFVKAGDVLFEIDPRPFQAAMEQAKADLLKAQAQQTNTNLVMNRQLELFAKKVVAESDKDTAVQQNAAAKATVEAAQAALDQAQLNLGFCKVLSAVDGVAGIAKPGIGDLVGPSGTAMTTVSTLNPIKANFQLGEQDYLRIAPRVNEWIKTGGGENSAPIELILTDDSVYPQKGKFDSINRQVDVRTGTIEISTLFANPGNILRPGQFARVRITTRIEKDAIIVPQRAVNEMQGIFQVGVVAPDGRASFRIVKVGTKTASAWVISEGLHPGDRVIVEGLQKLRPDASGSCPVDAQPWTPNTVEPGAAPQPARTK